MNDLNSILLEGNLTRDPEITEIQNKFYIAKLSIATNRTYKSNENRIEEVSFFDVEVCGDLAIACDVYLTKGRGVRIIGRLKQDRWTDPEGNTRSKVKVVAEHVKFKPQFQQT